MFFGNPRQCRDRRWRQRPGAAHVDIEAVAGRGRLDVERLADLDQWLRKRPGGFEGAGESRIENGAAVDRNDIVHLGRGEADLEHVMRAKARMQSDAAAASAMRVDQRRHVATELRLSKRLDHEIVLPGSVRLRLPM